MHTLRIASSVVVALCLAACGGEDEDSKPVATSVLTGTIDGRSFTAVSALARSDSFFPGEKFIDIFDVQRDCDDFAPLPTGGRSILLSREWKPMTQELSLSNNVTFVIREEDRTNNRVATTGRLELVDTPMEAGRTGMLRLRASLGQDRVEGQVSVTICD